jgi:prepilin-type N-terminal cleavage/methylation domain-containing protein
MSTLAGAREDEGGFTLVELLVAMSLFLVLGSLIMASVLSMSRATSDVRQFTNINEQARIATERITRELRQAKEIRGAEIPTTAGGDTSVTIGVDFNNTGTVETVTADPEVLTYRYDSSLKKLTLTANDETGHAVTRPILSQQVSAFTLQFRSSRWQYDGNNPTGVKDGVTDWTEIDRTPGIGNGNGVLDPAELAYVDLVSITLSVLEGSHKQTYETQVGLRNQAQN